MWEWRDAIDFRHVARQRWDDVSCCICWSCQRFRVATHRCRHDYSTRVSLASLSHQSQTASLQSDVMYVPFTAASSSSSSLSSSSDRAWYTGCYSMIVVGQLEIGRPLITAKLNCCLNTKRASWRSTKPVSERNQRSPSSAPRVSRRTARHLADSFRSLWLLSQCQTQRCCEFQSEHPQFNIKLRTWPEHWTYITYQVVSSL